MSPLTPAVCSLVCLISVGALSIMSDYDKRLKLLTSILAQDDYWKYVFRQNVYVDYHDHYHQVIVEQLMDGAKLDAPSSADAASTSEAPPPATASTRLAIKPLVFFRNLFLHNERYRVGSILKLAVKIVQDAFSCLAYKHTVHLLKVMRVEMSRTGNKSKASSWAGKAIPSFSVIIMKMAELDYMDGKLLRVAKFFYVYKNNSKKNIAKKFMYTPTLNRMSLEMQDYIQGNCVKAPKTEKLIAEELNVFHTSSLYNAGEARDLEDKTFKQMFVSVNNKIKSQVGDIPYTYGIPVEMWNEFLHFRPEDNEGIELLQINR